MNVTDRGMGLALGTLRRLAALEVLDRLGIRERTERAVHAATRNSARAAGAASRPFVAATKRARPARPQPSRSGGLFDLTPTEEQQMLQAAFGDFGMEQLRPEALAADDEAAAPKELLDQSIELGALMLAVPAALGGVVEERSAVTSVLAGEALARGDMGLAVACLAPAAVSNALALWGDAHQQAAYLGEFVGEHPPVAALAIGEPVPLFDPTRPQTRARLVDGDRLVLTGVKSLVPRAAEAELFLIGVDLEDCGPALVLVESGTAGVLVEPEPAMGVRAAATATLTLQDVEVSAEAVLGDGAPEVYAECVQRARLAWCAMATGTSQAVLDYVIPYVNERETFGEPVSHRQSVAFAVSDMAIELEGLRLATYRAASLADREQPFAREVALARQLAATRAMQIGSDGVQLLGGHGFVKEHPVERWYRDLRACGLMEGALLA